jgi:tetratricopeptide (TPR) repeat protein
MRQILNKFKIPIKYLHYLVLAGIVILTLIVYWDSFKNGFTILDDNILITDNKDIQNLSLSGILKIFSSFYEHAYDPLRILSYSLIYHIFGLNPIAFHSANIFFHLINIILVYVLIYQLTGLQSKEQSPQAAGLRIQVSAIAACLFAIHPMNSESICWLSALCDPQYSFYYLASLIFYLKYIQQSRVYSSQSIDRSKRSEARSQNKNYLFALLLFFCSCLSKSMAVTLPVILLLLDYYNGSLKLEAGCLKYWMKKAPFFLLALIFGIIASISEKFINTDNNNMIQYSLFNKFFLLTYSVSFYIINLIAPLKLSALHPAPEVTQGFLPYKYYLSPLLIIGLIFLILRLIKRKTFIEQQSDKTLIFGILFFLITISVTLIAGKVRPQQVADRYTYIPYLGLFFIIAIFLSPQSTVISLQKKRIMQNIKALIFIIFIVCFSIISYNRNKVWADNFSLFDDMLEKYPKVSFALNNRGLAKYYKNDFNGAILDYNKIIENNPHDAGAYSNRGVAKNALGDMQGAIKDFSKAIEIDPEFGGAYYNRGFDRGTIGDMEGALRDYNKAIEINPNSDGTFFIRGNTKASLGDKQGAIYDYNNALKINPRNVMALINRGYTKSSLGDIHGAIQDFNEAIDLNPKYAEAFVNRGNSKNALGDKHGALDDYNKAIELNQQNAQVYNNRGLTKYDLGDKYGALKDFNRAIELNPQYANAFKNRGSAKYFLGDKEGGCEDWRKAGEFGKTEASGLIQKYCHKLSH